MNVNDGDYVHLKSEYDSLKISFEYVCAKYNIKKCSTCKKFKQNTYTCSCGLVYCHKCDPIIDYKCIHSREVCCYKCSESLCSNCRLDTCAKCNNYICRNLGCVAYVCDGSRTKNCKNILCCESQCKYCFQLLCDDCVVDHEPCRPVRCSCGELVYLGKDALINCGICTNSWCKTCGSKHVANHAIIPLMIINNRAELPTLPPEIIMKIYICIIDG